MRVAAVAVHQTPARLLFLLSILVSRPHHSRKQLYILSARGIAEVKNAPAGRSAARVVEHCLRGSIRTQMLHRSVCAFGRRHRSVRDIGDVLRCLRAGMRSTGEARVHLAESARPILWIVRVHST